MTDDSMVSPQEIRSDALRVLAIERAIMRRAFSIMYAIAAANVFARAIL